MIGQIQAVDLNQPANYLQGGLVQVSPGNLVVIGVMVLLFILAVLLPFPKDRGDR